MHRRHRGCFYAVPISLIHPGQLFRTATQNSCTLTTLLDKGQAQALMKAYLASDSKQVKAPWASDLAATWRKVPICSSTASKQAMLLLLLLLPNNSTRCYMQQLLLLLAAAAAAAAATTRTKTCSAAVGRVGSAVCQRCSVYMGAACWHPIMMV